MKIITPAWDNVIKILGKAKKADAYRLMTYVVCTDIDEGVLLFHTLTRELLLLTKEEHAHLFDLPELYEKWFIVPEDTNDMQLVDQIRFVLKFMQKQSEHITSYTIFTTTDCNARCFYCFELGAKRQPMSEETALKTVDFIAAHCGDQPVSISWFGGEPLYNAKVIDLISSGLKERNIRYRSSMVSNGYLLNEETIRKAKELWQLRSVQITLDGTEEVYNKTKAFIYEDDASPFETVLSNIGKCLANEIDIHVRLNVTDANGDILKDLIRELSRRFGDNDYLSVYSAVIFQISQKEGEVADRAFQQHREIEALIRSLRLCDPKFLKRQPKLNLCQADSDNCVTILPSGKLGACEHYLDSGFIGDIYSGEVSPAKRAPFKACCPPITECAKCFYYTDCIRLEKCTGVGLCTALYREDLLEATKAQMKNTFYNASTPTEESDENYIC